jgi:three-Cys-motif partner protein
LPDGDFFTARREWSRWKHRLLYRYLGKFAAILGSRHHTIFYVDGFAGAGQYTDPPEPGSPVIAATLARDAEAVQRGYTLKCINVEPTSFDSLVAATTSVAPRLVDNRRGTFRDHIPDILTTIGREPALFFLDPYGHKGMEWDVVEQIAQRARSGRKTELLLNLYSTKIDRDAGWIDSTATPGPAFVARLDRFFGTTEWQGLYTGASTYEERMSALTNLYLQRLANAFSGIAASYPIKTMAGLLKYHLILGTPSVHGALAMSDVVYRVAREYDQEQDAHRPQDANLELFPPPRPTEEQRDATIAVALADDILALRTRSATWTFRQIQEELVSKWFGRALEKHYRAACKRLKTDGKLRVIPPNRPSSRGSRGGINDDTKLELL